MQTSSLSSSHNSIPSSGFAIPRATLNAGRELRSIYLKAPFSSSGLTLSLPSSSPLNPPLGGIMGGYSHPRGIVVDIQFARGLVQSPPVRAVTERLVLREPAGADIEGFTIRRLYLIRPVPVVSHKPSHYVIRHLTRLKTFKEIFQYYSTRSILYS